MIYNEISTCQVCGSKSNLRIQAYGDYDGPEKPRETNPADCPTCDGIKKANISPLALRAGCLWVK